MRARCPSRTPITRFSTSIRVHSRPFASAPRYRMERVAGIEPAPSAWKAEVLPLNYTRRLDGNPPRRTLAVGTSPHGVARKRPARTLSRHRTLGPRERAVVEGVGFEPTKAEPSDLQSGPFGHSGTPPGIQHKRREIVRFRRPRVNDIQRRRDPAAQAPLPPAGSVRKRNGKRPAAPTRSSCNRAPGAATRNRTLDLLITSELLYRLSYGGRTTSQARSKIGRF